MFGDGLLEKWGLELCWGGGVGWEARSLLSVARSRGGTALWVNRMQVVSPARFMTLARGLSLRQACPKPSCGQ